MSRVPSTATATAAQHKEVLTVNALAKSPRMVTRFAEVLGGQDKANQFLASVISAVNGNSSLQKCDPGKVIGCAMIAASLNLDINANLGFASIVPYKDPSGKFIPQFQMGWKGIVQLAIRTNQYRTMNVTPVYADEFEAYDPFMGELKYHLVSGGDRYNNRDDRIVGYAFYFELNTGFSKMAYMSKEEAQAHAQRFSKAYQYDLKYNKQSSPWSTMFDKMAMKTIVKNTLNKWGILSTQLMMADRADQSSTTISDNGDIGEFEYVDNDGSGEQDEPAPRQEIPVSPAAAPAPAQADNGPESFDDSGDFYDGPDDGTELF